MRGFERLNYMPLRVLSLSFLFLVVVSACYEPKEGCLDLDAVNYDASADDPCVDCCQMPALSVSFSHQALLATQTDTTINFKYDSLYPSPLDKNHYFQITRSRFFISNLHLVKVDGTEVGVQDSIELEAPAGDTVTVEDNFVKVDRDIFQGATPGTIVTTGNFDRMRFTLGLSDALRQTDPISVPAKHALDVAGDSLMYAEGTGYLSHLLIFKRDTLSATVPIELKMTEPVTIELPLPQTIEVLRGFNLSLKLKINYLAWFEDIDLVNDSELTIEQKLVENLPKAFSVTEIKMEGG
jgi:methanobactin biosynthesis MbnP-like protein